MKIKIIFYCTLLSTALVSGCSSTNIHSPNSKDNNITNAEAMALGGGLAVAWVANPIVGIVVGAGTYYILEDEIKKEHQYE
ncbi:hypothetical protein AADZ86_16130 [Colwelliaceae bacterium BS250]